LFDLCGHLELFGRESLALQASQLQAVKHITQYRHRQVGDTVRFYQVLRGLDLALQSVLLYRQVFGLLFDLRLDQRPVCLGRLCFAFGCCQVLLRGRDLSRLICDLLADRISLGDEVCQLFNGLLDGVHFREIACGIGVVEGSAQGAGLAIGQSLALGFQVDDFLDQAASFCRAASSVR
jgi:hypothetical protein